MQIKIGQRYSNRNGIFEVIEVNEKSDQYTIRVVQKFSLYNTDRTDYKETKVYLEERMTYLIGQDKPLDNYHTIQLQYPVEYIYLDTSVK